jgi:pimeloyl-ACP methyl ester carboxylesterase
MEKRTSSGIAYDDLGVGEPALVCLPGWGTHRTIFRAFAEKLAARRRVLTLDWRGHGTSVPTMQDFGDRELLNDALGVVAHSGVDRVVPVAQAHAGWIALAMRDRMGPRVAKAVFVSWMMAAPPSPFAAALRALQDEHSWEATRAQLLSMWLSGGPPEVESQVRREMESHGFGMWMRAGREIAAAFAREGNPFEALTRRAFPSLHLYSQPRAEDYFAMQQNLAGEHSWFAVERLDGHTHFPSLELPDESSAAVERFLG